jgi:hypothetical protein
MLRTNEELSTHGTNPQYHCFLHHDNAVAPGNNYFEAAEQQFSRRKGVSPIQNVYF